MILILYTLFVDVLACSKSENGWQKQSLSTLSPDDARNLATFTNQHNEAPNEYDEYETLYPIPITTTRTRQESTIFLPPPIIPVQTVTPKILTTTLQPTTVTTTRPRKCVMLYRIPTIPKKCPDCDNYCRSQPKVTSTQRSTKNRSRPKNTTPRAKRTTFWFW